ncbi:MAG TPA: hypothetical protein VKV04_25710 [Verrucomicrobiae bacterium]|nr:hypothetical protein [Verrucomicrobiae bacterium]
MPVDSPLQAVARGVIFKLAQNQSPVILSPQEFSVVAGILNGFTGALASAVGIPTTPIPPDKELNGRVSLDDLQRGMLKAMLLEYVAIPTGQGQG